MNMESGDVSLFSSVRRRRFVRRLQTFSFLFITFAICSCPYIVILFAFPLMDGRMSKVLIKYKQFPLKFISQHFSFRISTHHFCHHHYLYTIVGCLHYKRDQIKRYFLHKFQILSTSCVSRISTHCVAFATVTFTFFCLRISVSVPFPTSTIKHKFPIENRVNPSSLEHPPHRSGLKQIVAYLPYSIFAFCKINRLMPHVCCFFRSLFLLSHRSFTMMFSIIVYTMFEFAH